MCRIKAVGGIGVGGSDVEMKGYGHERCREHGQYWEDAGTQKRVMCKLITDLEK